MLVLGRKVGEKVYIGDNIVVMIVASARGGVRLGFEAPPDVSIKREEIVQRGTFGQTGPPFDHPHTDVSYDEMVSDGSAVESAVFRPESNTALALSAG